MNKYTANGITDAAEQGRRFLIVNHNATTSREAFNTCRDAATNPSRILTANGHEAIHWANGGMIAFIALNRGAGRGYSADVLYIGSGCDEVMSLDQWESLLPTIATSPTGEVIRA